MAYWIFIKRDTFVKVDFSKYKRNLSIYRDILTIGIPASLEVVCICIVTIFINSLLVGIGGNMAVAAYGVAMRIISVVVTPISGIGLANITVVGTAFGARNKKNIKTAFDYSTKATLIIAVFTCLFILLFAGNLAQFFTNGDAGNNIDVYITNILYILGFFCIYSSFKNSGVQYTPSYGKGNNFNALYLS